MFYYGYSALYRIKKKLYTGARRCRKKCRAFIAANLTMNILISLDPSTLAPIQSCLFFVQKPTLLFLTGILWTSCREDKKKEGAIWEVLEDDEQVTWWLA